VDWEVELHDDVARWFEGLCRADRDNADLVEAAIDHLAQEGPRLGRPLVDRIHNSRFHNMKELRPASTKSSEVRILFVFDPARRAILLVAGDKAGHWQDWYRTNIPIADRCYAEHLAATTVEEG
jgi:hypothetical protein